MAHCSDFPNWVAVAAQTRSLWPLQSSCRCQEQVWYGQAGPWWDCMDAALSAFLIAVVQLLFQAPEPRMRLQSLKSSISLSHVLVKSMDPGVRLVHCKMQWVHPKALCAELNCIAPAADGGATWNEAALELVTAVASTVSYQIPANVLAEFIFFLRIKNRLFLSLALGVVGRLCLTFSRSESAINSYMGDSHVLQDYLVPQASFVSC